ncbi:NADH dehydrogenase [ubiquinone] 1 alpha subcomplex subunit 10 [Anaeramoeba flamelloides]|uniref:NADH dehydrogenase [ubiquinone] 1 alpha subcomplex subunit 10 n=1 Tax=Anaeramoeba flamelloides TaxID=1746091 RepID=A0AAV7YJY7_9EUKA|nr:NADH dehydrogenase [ubiquinone] 1 alpha subcomplex subunit 10 [Anaeramoeba flamelloides]
MTFLLCEGNISAGKTTLVRELAKLLDYQVFFEPTATNPFLEQYYQDQKTWALPMQLYLLRQRFMTYVNCLKHIESGKVKGAILDRSLFSDWVFAKKNYDDGFIDEEGWKLYSSLRKKMISLIPIPQITLFLDVPSKICYDRIHNLRGRKCESGIPLDYLLGLEERYVYLLDELKQMGGNVVKVDWSQFGYAVDVLKKIINKLSKNKSSNLTINETEDPDQITDQLKTLLNSWEQLKQQLGNIFDFASYEDFKETTQDITKLRKLLKVDSSVDLSKFLITDKEQDVEAESTILTSEFEEILSENDNIDSWQSFLENEYNQQEGIRKRQRNIESELKKQIATNLESPLKERVKLTNIGNHKY